MTQAQVDEYMRRTRARVKTADAIDAANAPGVEEEVTLHHEILDYCRRHRHACFHGSMASRTHRTPGEPDFCVVAHGQILLVECKTRTGKLSEEQMAVAKLVEMNGHRVHVVRHFREFLNLLGMAPGDKQQTS